MALPTHFSVQVRSSLGKIGPKTHALLLQVAEETAGEIKGEAQRLVPVDTGELQRSIYATVVPGVPTWISVGATAAHAVYVEYGTSMMPARPFLTPAVENNKQRFYGRCGRAVQKGAGG